MDMCRVSSSSWAQGSDREEVGVERCNLTIFRFGTVFALSHSEGIKALERSPTISRVCSMGQSSKR